MEDVSKCIYNSLDIVVNENLSNAFVFCPISSANTSFWNLTSFRWFPIREIYFLQNIILVSFALYRQLVRYTSYKFKRKCVFVRWMHERQLNGMKHGSSTRNRFIHVINLTQPFITISCRISIMDRIGRTHIKNYLLNWPEWFETGNLLLKQNWNVFNELLLTLIAILRSPTVSLYGKWNEVALM